MRAFAMTGMVTAAWISSIFVGSDMRATPPCARMSAGTRSSAMTAAAPAASAMAACSAVTTSMITPPLSISARPDLTRNVARSLTRPMITTARVAISPSLSGGVRRAGGPARGACPRGTPRALDRPPQNEPMGAAAERHPEQDPRSRERPDQGEHHDLAREAGAGWVDRDEHGQRQERRPAAPQQRAEAEADQGREQDGRRLRKRHQWPVGRQD